MTGNKDNPDLAIGVEASTLEKRVAAAGIAGAELAEVLALSLIDRDLIDREDICSLLESLAHSHREAGEVGVTTALTQLALSLRAARPQHTSGKT